MKRVNVLLSRSLVFAALSALAGCTAPAPAAAEGDVGHAALAESMGPAGFSFCAEEYQWCSFTGTRTVAYGANGVFAYKTFTDGVLCSNANFGDPLRGVDKKCYVQ